MARENMPTNYIWKPFVWNKNKKNILQIFMFANYVKVLPNDEHIIYDQTLENIPNNVLVKLVLLIIY